MMEATKQTPKQSVKAQISGDKVVCVWEFQGESLKHFISRRHGRAVDSPDFDGPFGTKWRLFAYPNGQRGTADGSLCFFVKWQQSVSPHIRRLDCWTQLSCSEGPKWSARRLLPPLHRDNTAAGKIAFIRCADLQQCSHFSFTATVRILECYDRSNEGCKAALMQRTLSEPASLSSLALPHSLESVCPINSETKCEGCAQLSKQLAWMQQRMDRMHRSLLTRIDDLASLMTQLPTPPPIKDTLTDDTLSLDFLSADPPAFF